MTRVGRNGIQRSEKVARRDGRKQKRQHRVAAGAAALATVAAIGAGQLVEPAPAEAAFLPPAIEDLRDWSNGFDRGNPLGGLISEIGNGELAAAIAEQWRIQSCVSAGAGGGADCSQSSTDLGGLGIAIVLPDRIEVVPVMVYDPVKGVYDSLSGSVLGDIVRWLGINLPPELTDAPETSGSSTVGGNGFQLAVAFRGGDATAFSYLPLSIATAGASDGNTAKSFALLGMAHAWNTGPLDVTVLGQDTGLTIPGIKGVGCYGGLTGAYADGVGACANVLGTFDFRYRQPDGEIQFALTDPSALFTDPTGVLGGLGQEVLTGLLTAMLSGSGIDFDGDWMSLSKDFARLSVGGDHDLFSGNFLRLTSDYGFTDSITVDWLGSTISFRPLVEVNGELRPNRLGRPVIEFGQLDTGQIVPIVRIPSYEFPFGIPATDPIGGASPSVLARTSAASGQAPGEPAATTVDTHEAAAPDPAALDTAEVETDSYVGKHRAADDGYEGKHRAPDSAPAGAVGDDAGGGDPDGGDPDGGDPDGGDPDGGDPDGGDAGSSGSDGDGSDSGGSDSGGSDSGGSDSGGAGDSGDTGSDGATGSGDDAGSDAGSDTDSGSGSEEAAA
ncbi:hypothetical protein [Gordonia jinghuaiqii]|uniref:hypothetical protein n=1 Tax=Gordonia jinghuaiqii TaxID=2758710 RepID=UPI001CB791C4|nr:hypothetical protein [Gordonia jinghuaiqii]